MKFKKKQKTNLLSVMYIYLNVQKQMTDVKLLEII